MASAAVELFATAHPQDTITLVGAPLTLSVFEQTPYPCELIPYDRKGNHAGLKGMVQFAVQLRNHKFDEAYLLTNSFSSAFMVWLPGIPKRIGTPGQWKRGLLTATCSDFPPKLHQASRYTKILLDECPKSLQPMIYLSDEERKIYRGKITAITGDRPRIALAAGAAYGSAKRWPPERFVALAKRCVEELGTAVLLFGSPLERAVSEEIQQQAGQGVFCLAGRTALREMYGYLECCTAAVANDSGLMHCAAALGTPIVGIFGPTSFEETGPLGEQVSIVHHELSCAPCFKRECPLGHQNCMKEITVDEVFEALKYVSGL